MKRLSIGVAVLSIVSLSSAVAWAKIDHTHQYPLKKAPLKRKASLTCRENFMSQLDVGILHKDGLVTVDRNDPRWVFILDLEPKTIRLRDDLGYIDDEYGVFSDTKETTIAVHFSPAGGGLYGEVFQVAWINWETGLLLWSRTNDQQIKSFVFQCE